MKLFLRNCSCYQRVVFSHTLYLWMDRSAYLMAAYRPRCPVLAVTRDLVVARHMQLYRGLVPVHFREPRLADWTEDMDTRIYYAVDAAWDRHVSYWAEL